MIDKNVVDNLLKEGLKNMTNDLKEEIFHSVLCNGGFDEFKYHGFVVECRERDYKEAKSKLDNPCHEDVLMQVLKDGKALKFIDEEGEGEYSKDITIDDVYDMVERVSVDTLITFLKEEDDANDGDIFLQYLLYKEIIFG